MGAFLTNFRDEMLYCIHFTCKVISENIAGNILATHTQRQQWYEECNTGCSLMVINLKTYSQKKSKTICMQCFGRKLKTQGKKVKKELQGTRDFFGAYFICQQIVKELDLKMLLAYRLISVPLTFTHVDGLKISTDKSTLFVSSR